MAASGMGKESSAEAPVIGKMGRYTVFLTPSSAPKPSLNPSTGLPSEAELPKPKVSPPPPQFYDKPSTNSLFGFFWDALSKAQNFHSSLDDYLADWFGLNQSKYQWALNDYYESKGTEKEGSKPKKAMNEV